jgi:hypothetical protein
MIPEILETIQPMYGPIDVMLQDNYTKLNALQEYAIKNILAV